ncbi:RecBCD enzyme subunit RecB [Arenimonas soli]|uniref:RecBCD enzyme subunit RecB n=1 Tax=Arenimonas soli TaxID=2269504 RepID=A0ABQ1HTB9_9GAMM|nr:UvrD-helicase domain-containing protein [Arenimonas soli]GGA87743.1 RecBCD enzyme subunit RecB [Arenimonas soli]
MSGLIRVRHWSELPLDAPGRSLVEASAGTGKTWTIAVLYLRLLLEPAKAFTVDQLVVTTFTDAAAQELRERLRQALRDALALADATRAGNPAPEAPDDSEAWLLQRWADGESLAEDRRRLRLALADFDRAPVGTLHGLCQRILVEHPFDSGSRFEVGEPTSGQALSEELARDAWRVLHQGGGKVPAGFDLDALKLSTFTKQLRQLMAPGVRIDVIELAQVRAALPVDFTQGLRELADDKATYVPKKTALAAAMRELAQFLDGEDESLRTSALPYLRKIALEEFVIPERIADFDGHSAIQALRQHLPAIEAALEAPTLRFWQQQAEQTRQWRDERLAARGQVTFDEMIRRAHAAIVANPALADALFDAWPVALVDEFQDTDAQQYGILDRLYRDADGMQRGRLVMIGDPKQAIYGFRGGDIHAYRRARGDAQHLLELGTNHRSSRNYVQAVNQWYAAGSETLGRSGSDDVQYREVSASDRRDAAPYSINGEPLACPLQVHYRDPAPDGQPRRRRDALVACANRIAAMLASGEHRIGDKPLQPGDIAVLVPTNRDIASLRALLQARRVPCVGGARDSVFAGDMAFELHLLLVAVLDADNEPALRAALLTRLWGGDLAMLATLDAHSPLWPAISVRLAALRERWRREGVLGLTRQLAQEAAPRLLATPRGERELTDLHHLGELLQQRAERGGGPRELLAWLGDQRRDEGDADSADERQPRLESDAKRVQLMTLHRSKGLEFNVVFLPLMWAQGGGVQHRPYLVPLPEGGRRAAFDEAAKLAAKWEGQDERFRTLYVALTRAIHACHVYALDPERTASNSKTPRADPDRAPLDAMVARVLDDSATGSMPQVAWHEDDWSGDDASLPPTPVDVSRRTVPDPPADAPLRQRLSFSTLVSGHRAAPTEEAPADDEPLASEAPNIEAGDDAAHPELLALASVRGPAFGNALHAAFEHRRQGEPLFEQQPLLHRELDAYGVRPNEVPFDTLVPALARRMDDALAAGLLPGLSLGAVSPQRQRAEMAFHFRLDAARLSRLRDACAAHGDPGLVPPLAVDRLRGLMTGKIDLVFEHEGRFHVLDYKGNWLGDRVADYTGAPLRAAMDHSHYRLQALLYTLALHRFLRQRLPDYAPATHLGEFIYLFVRAAGLGPGAGVYAERFPDALVADVDAAFAEADKEATA